MKKPIHKLLCALMAVCVVLSAVPFSAFADDASSAASGTTTNGSYTDGVWSAGGTGSVTYDVNGTDVTLSKTAAAVAGMENTFDITLTVRTSTTSVSRTSAAAVVLVIDTSNSMNYCSECGNEKEHDSDCTYYQKPSDRPGPGNRVDNRVKDTQTRIAATKSAAIAFLQNYAGTDAAANRQLAIVQFGTHAWTKLTWVNVAGGTGKNSYDAAVRAINGLTVDGGTNLDDGLYTANNLLDSVSDYGTKGVVLLTDGIPTYRRAQWGNGTEGTGNSGDEKNNDAAAAQAKAIRDKSASLYTICFGVANEVTYSGGPTVGNFLSGSIASSGCAYNADDADDVYAAFRAISESITSGLSGTGWTATDPMADMIAVSSAPANITTADGHTYTWTLDNAQTETVGDVTTYVYTTTYRVTLDVQGQNFVEGQFFPTNEETFLNIDNEPYAFPVPGVKGTLPRTSVTVTKQWNDNDDQDGKRPNSVTVQLMEGSTTIGEPVTLNEANGWSYTWTGLIEKSKGVYHTYTVEELNVPEGYTATYPTNDNNRFALTVVNTHTVAKTDVTVNKVWDDKENQDGIRPGSITVNLLANGSQVGTAELNAANNWSHTFTGLDECANGRPITYTVEEVDVPEGYTASVNGLTVTNTHTTATTAVPVTKMWDDNNNQDGIRPESITVKLLANGEDTGKTLVLSSGNNWTGSFTDLDKFANSSEITYTVAEDAVTGYTTTISGSAANGYIITNSHTPEVVAIEGSKTWDDNDNQDGKRPPSITINLLANGVKVDTKTVTAADGWKWSFENLPKKENGQDIVYSITEDAVEDYTTAYNGYNVTNSYTPEKTSITVTKSWLDADNQDGIRPNDITVKLLANGQDTEKTLVLSSGNNWTGSFTELDVFVAQEEIVYTVEEVEIPDGYNPVITGDMTTGFTITNSHTPEVVTISGSKTWDDNDNQDGARPDEIIINLNANGVTVAEVTVTAEDDWVWNFENMPKYEDGGKEIVYSITEEAVEDYSTTYDGYDVTNTHTPAQTSITVTKSWQDNGDQDGIRPEKITVILLANGDKTGKTLTLSKDNNWTGSFTELDVFDAQEEIVYTIQEIEITGYTTVITGTPAEGFTITNSHTPETVNITGSKTWNDNNNQDGARPDAITIHLNANGVSVSTKTVTAADGWKWNFEGMPKYENGGSEIVYTITEDAVEGYSATYDGYNITNSYTPASINISVKKVWVDSNDGEKIRPNSVTVHLIANGKDTGLTLKLSDKNNWLASFENMPKYADGELIRYEITEDTVKGYNAVITGTAADGFTVTNSHNYIPKTGDESTPLLWMSLMGMSLLIMAAAATSLLTGKKKKY